MKTLTLQVPDSLTLDPKEAAMLLATRLYERGELSLGQAAELAGYSKRTFMELLGDYGVAVFDMTEEELLNDVQNAARYHR
jgi:predicted HTH domain antitoxin